MLTRNLTPPLFGSNRRTGGGELFKNFPQSRSAITSRGYIKDLMDSFIDLRIRNHPLRHLQRAGKLGAEKFFRCAALNAYLVRRGWVRESCRAEGGQSRLYRLVGLCHGVHG